MNDEETAVVALIENIQRENLSAIEEAEAYKKLLEIGQTTHT
jgi:ParB family chromosome partitioning protein